MERVQRIQRRFARPVGRFAPLRTSNNRFRSSIVIVLELELVLDSLISTIGFRGEILSEPMSAGAANARPAVARLWRV
jgi:hypothetical protein